VDLGVTATLTGPIDGDALLTKTGAGQLTIANTCWTDITVEEGTVAVEAGDLLVDEPVVRLAEGTSLDLADETTNYVSGLYFNDVPQAAGTWGRTGSGADHINDTYFSGRTGVLSVYWWAIPGDANMDCKVNILDLIFVRNRLNQSPATGDNFQADVNTDGKINILDLIFVRNRLNTSCE